MFQFGLFSTHLPYLMMGLVYAFYLGFSSVKSIESGRFSEGLIEMTEPFTFVCEELLQDEQTSQKGSSFFSYLQNLYDFHFDDYPIGLNHELKNELLPKLGITSSRYFNKPPPALI